MVGSPSRSTRRQTPRVPISLFPNQPSLQIVWPFVAKILAAAHLPAVQYIEVLKMLRLKEADVAEESLREMLRREGYAFALPNPNVLPIELDRLGRRTFLFVSDPREAAAREYSVQGRAASDPVPFDGFLRSRALGFIATQYSRLTEFCRRRQHVKVIRCEDVVGSWYRLAIELVETLGLRIPPEIVFQISKSTAATARTTPTTAFRERLDSAARAGLEEKFAAEMAYFGYAPEEVLPAAFVQRQSEFVRAVCAPLAASPEQPTRRRQSPHLFPGRPSRLAPARPVNPLRAPAVTLRTILNCGCATNRMLRMSSPCWDGGWFLKSMQADVAQCSGNRPSAKRFSRPTDVPTPSAGHSPPKRLSAPICRGSFLPGGWKIME